MLANFSITTRSGGKHLYKMKLSLDEAQKTISDVPVFSKLQHMESTFVPVRPGLQKNLCSLKPHHQSRHEESTRECGMLLS